MRTQPTFTDSTAQPGHDPQCVEGSDWAATILGNGDGGVIEERTVIKAIGGRHVATSVCT